MMQGIQTRYMGPTDRKGSRIKAVARKASSWGPAMQMVVPLDQSLSIEARHTKAAKALAEKLGWSGLWIAGGAPDESSYQFVCCSLPAPQPDARGYVEGLGYVDSDWFHVAKREG